MSSLRSSLSAWFAAGVGAAAGEGIGCLAFALYARTTATCPWTRARLASWPGGQLGKTIRRGVSRQRRKNRKNRWNSSEGSFAGGITGRVPYTPALPGTTVQPPREMKGARVHWRRAELLRPAEIVALDIDDRGEWESDRDRIQICMICRQRPTTWQDTSLRERDRLAGPGCHTCEECRLAARRDRIRLPGMRRAIRAPRANRYRDVGLCSGCHSQPSLRRRVHPVGLDLRVACDLFDTTAARLCTRTYCEDCTPEQRHDSGLSVFGGRRSGEERRAATAKRDARILSLLADGLSTRSVAAMVGVHQSTVVRVRNRPVTQPLRAPSVADIYRVLLARGGLR